MANSLRVLAYLPKRPFDPAGSFLNRVIAEELAANLREMGYEVKVTGLKTGPRKKTVIVYNVWKRNKETQT